MTKHKIDPAGFAGAAQVMRDYQRSMTKFAASAKPIVEDARRKMREAWRP